jgi:CRISPR/Cas system CSM-associated protein Csm3 (group 7 of RAMP superfamily)
MMTEFSVDLRITIETALAVGGSGSMGTLADKSMLRDGWNRPVLPASQVKGRVRHACEAIARGLGIPICQTPSPETTCPHHPDVPAGADGERRCPICHIFGSPAFPSRLRFRDLIHTPITGDPAGAARLHIPHEPLRPGIGVERRRGTVQEALLFLTETTMPGVQPVFQREPAISGDLPSAGHALLVLMGLDQVLNWGGAKSRGLGWAQVEYEAHYDASRFTLADPVGKEVLAQWITG